MELLEAELPQAGKAEQFEQLKAFLIGDHPGATYDDVAAKTGNHGGGGEDGRLAVRRRYRKLLRDEIAQTVAGPRRWTRKFVIFSRLWAANGQETTLRFRNFPSEEVASRFDRSHPTSRPIADPKGLSDDRRQKMSAVRSRVAGGCASRDLPQMLAGGWHGEQYTIREASVPMRRPTTPLPGSSRFVPPSPQELARHFPQLEILELLGAGGMGAVYKARQPGLDRLVALKILPPEVGADPAFAERFTREAQALARLSHPNIVSVYDFGSGRADFTTS